jgi:hypothetical protein
MVACQLPKASAQGIINIAEFLDVGLEDRLPLTTFWGWIPWNS